MDSDFKIQIEVAEQVVAGLERSLHHAKQSLNKLHAQCTHKFVPTRPWDGKDKWFSAWGTCEHCNKRSSTWWCTKSANGACDYNQPDGTYDEDNCIHCGMPDERK